MTKQIDFIGMRKVWFLVSAAVILAGLISIALPGRGLRLGIDFTGGVMLDLRFERAVTTSEVREALSNVGLAGSQIQRTQDSPNEVLIRTRSVTQEEFKAMNAALESRLGKFQTLRIEEVKGVIGGELTRKGLLALLIANVGMIIYITLRFEYKFALTGIAALVHDVLVVLGVYSILGLEANSPLIAAVLTIVGYSINDTIVVFDRIRENLKKRKKESLAEVVNLSINQTMTRSLNTSLTTLLAVLAVFVFGGRTTRDFALALMVGITAGTYSSIFIASPLWYLWKFSEERAGLAAQNTPQPARTGQANTSVRVAASHSAATKAQPSAKPMRKR